MMIDVRDSATKLRRDSTFTLYVVGDKFFLLLLLVVYILLYFLGSF